jgi:hypothetical protein
MRLQSIRNHLQTLIQYHMATTAINVHGFTVFPSPGLLCALTLFSQFAGLMVCSMYLSGYHGEATFQTVGTFTES